MAPNEAFLSLLYSTVFIRREFTTDEIIFGRFAEEQAKTLRRHRSSLPPQFDQVDEVQVVLLTYYLGISNAFISDTGQNMADNDLLSFM